MMKAPVVECPAMTNDLWPTWFKTLLFLWAYHSWGDFLTRAISAKPKFYYQGVSINGGNPNGWFISWKIPLEMDENWGYPYD